MPIRSAAMIMAVVLLPALDATADQGVVLEDGPNIHRLEWTWRPVQRGEVITSTAAIIGAIVLNQVKEPKRNWTGGILFDGAFRDGLRLSGRAQARVKTASDVLQFGLIAWPLLVDTMGISLIGDKNRGVSGQLLGIQFQALAMTSLLTTLTKTTVGRERPAFRDVDCTDPAVDCGSQANRSFFSGHSAYAFTGAALICSEQRHLQLYGRVGGKIACGAALTAASSVALFRVMADEHWTTDVLTGAGVGLFSGWLMPWLLHYRHPREDAAQATFRSWAPFGSRERLGLAYFGTF